MNSGICKNVRKANYDRGLKYGNKVLHGSDLSGAESRIEQWNYPKVE